MPVQEFVPLASGPLRDAGGNPIANGVLFVTEVGNNNRAHVYQDKFGAVGFSAWPYPLDAEGRASLWIPKGSVYYLKVFNSTGSLLLFEGTNVEADLRNVIAPNGTLTKPSKTLTYTNGVLTQVDEFTDASKTTLRKRKTLNYTNGVLTSVVTLNGDLQVTATRSLSYQGGVLVGITDS